MPKKIAVVTDMDMNGSGYYFLTTPILSGLAKLGHEIKVAGLSYAGTEHDFPFSIIPARELMDCVAIINNLHYVWNMDIILVAMDIPLQIQLSSQFAQYKKKYIAITPLENGPLTMSWSAPLFNLDSIFFISELGKQEAIKSGLSKAEHLIIGVDSGFWRPPINDEKSLLRRGLGIGDDEFVVLTVADNQERKNLWAGMEAMSRLKKSTDKKIRYILVTRENSPFGWKLRDLAVKLDINQEFNIFNRGIPIKDLWGLYAVSDVYLSTSKAEGLGMPVLEAMSCKVPVVATDTGALHELLYDDRNPRGFLIPSEYSFIDVWGNSKRDMIDVDRAYRCLLNICNDPPATNVTKHAREYAEDRTWDIPVTQMDHKIKELFDEK